MHTPIEDLSDLTDKIIDKSHLLFAHIEDSSMRNYKAWLVALEELKAECDKLQAVYEDSKNALLAEIAKDAEAELEDELSKFDEDDYLSN
jgi:competence protein ComGF